MSAIVVAGYPFRATARAKPRMIRCSGLKEANGGAVGIGRETTSRPGRRSGRGGGGKLIAQSQRSGTRSGSSLSRRSSRRL